MKRLLKIVIITLVVLVAAAFGGVWYLNRWLQSPETHAQVERELSKALKLPLKFKSLEISLMGGLRAEGVTVPDEGYNFFEVSSFSAKHRLLPLFRGDMVLDEVVVDAPRFVMVQRPDGKWKMPELPDDLKAAKKTAGKEQKPEEAQPGAKKKGTGVRIEHITITNASVELFDKDKKPYAGAMGLRIALKDVRGENIEGRVFIARLMRHGVFAVTDFNAGVSLSESKGLTIPDFIAKCGGGTVTGGYWRKGEKSASRFSAKAQITDVDLTRASMDGDAPPPEITGVMTATFDVRGTNDDTNAMEGKGSVSLRGGTCKKIEMVKQYADIVQEAATFSIPLATADLQVWNGRLNVKPLKISAPPLTITATGLARFDGKLDLDAVLAAETKFLEGRPTIAAQFAPPDASGMRALPFHVNGTLTSPKNDLKEKITGSKDARVQREVAIKSAVDSIFGPAEKEEKKREPEKER